MQECKEPETPFLDSALSLAASHLDRSAIGYYHPLSPALRIRGRKAEATSKSKLGDESWLQIGGLAACLGGTLEVFGRKALTAL